MQNQIGFAMIQKVGNLGRAIVRIDRHAGNAERVERQLVQAMLRPVLQRHSYSVPVAITGVPIARDQLIDRACGICVVDFVSVLVITARRVRRHAEERPVAMARDGFAKRHIGRLVHNRRRLIT